MGDGPSTGYTGSEILAGTDKISKHLEIQSLSQLILDGEDRRLARQRRAELITEGRDHLEKWFRNNVLRHALMVDCDKADGVKWDRDNAIFADVLLRADEDVEESGVIAGTDDPDGSETAASFKNELGIPLDSQKSQPAPRGHSRSRTVRRSKLFPCHRAMLIRSEFFLTMFSSSFREAQRTPHLQIIPIACSPAVLEIILLFLYTEKTDFPLDMAVDVLFAADLLFLEKLKIKAAVVISTLGNGTATALPTEADDGARDDESIDIYEILRVAWLTRVQRLETFAARYMAYRLESYIEDPAFAEIVKESAGRISARQETDSIELVDDIRWYLSERFRLRFEDSGLEDLMEEGQKKEQQQQQQQLDEDQVQDDQRRHKEREDGTELPLPNWGTGLPTQNQHSHQHQHQQPFQEIIYDDDEAVDMSKRPPPTATGDPAANPTRTPAHKAPSEVDEGGVVRTMDGNLAVDEFARDAINYRILLGKIDQLLERLKLDA